jgi:hypothetical protein
MVESRPGMWQILSKGSISFISIEVAAHMNFVFIGNRVLMTEFCLISLSFIDGPICSNSMVAPYFKQFG